MIRHSSDPRALLIAVFFDAPGFDDYPFSEEEYRTAYHEVATLVQSAGATFAIVRGQGSYRGQMSFTRGWVFDGKTFEAHSEALTVDLIWNKGHFRPEPTARILNVPSLDTLCTDKWATYQRFPACCPQTILVRREEDLAPSLQRLQGAIVVCKPCDGEEGRGVLITTKENIRLSSHIRYPCLVQELIDTSCGIPGIVEGPHDLRIIGVAEEIGVSYIRTPPRGSLKANVSKGGREIEIPITEIPAEALTLFRTIDGALAAFPHRIYSVDMGRHCDGTWKIIELNSKPGLSPQRTGVSYRRFQELLAKTLVSAATG